MFRDIINILLAIATLGLIYRLTGNIWVSMIAVVVSTAIFVFLEIYVFNQPNIFTGKRRRDR